MNMNTESNRPGSLVMLASSMLIFGTIGIFRRFIPLSSGLLAFARGAIGALFLILVVLIRGRLRRLREDRKRELNAGILFLLILSGGLIGVNWILLFEAYNYTTVATATLCYYMQPTIVILLSPLFFWYPELPVRGFRREMPSRVFCTVSGRRSCMRLLLS